MSAIVITGTDTGAGKTVAAAMLTLALGGFYWKPVQAGDTEGTDSQRVAAMTGLPASRILPEAYVFKAPLSPHRAAALENRIIDPARLALPELDGGQSLLAEGAGGVHVPLTENFLQIDLFARWAAPVVVVARTELGTINHSLLTLDALRARAIPVLGIIFSGPPMEDSEKTIACLGRVKRLGRIPLLDRLDRETLLKVFQNHFRIQDFPVGA